MLAWVIGSCPCVYFEVRSSDYHLQISVLFFFRYYITRNLTLILSLTIMKNNIVFLLKKNFTILIELLRREHEVTSNQRSDMTILLFAVCTPLGNFFIWKKKLLNIWLHILEYFLPLCVIISYDSECAYSVLLQYENLDHTLKQRYRYVNDVLTEHLEMRANNILCDKYN